MSSMSLQQIDDLIFRETDQARISILVIIYLTFVRSSSILFTTDRTLLRVIVGKGGRWRLFRTLCLAAFTGLISCWDPVG